MVCVLERKERRQRHKAGSNDFGCQGSGGVAFRGERAVMPIYGCYGAVKSSLCLFSHEPTMQENQPEQKTATPRKRFVGRAKRSQAATASGDTPAIEDGAIGFASMLSKRRFADLTT